MQSMCTWTTSARASYSQAHTKNVVPWRLSIIYGDPDVCVCVCVYKVYVCVKMLTVFRGRVRGPINNNISFFLEIIRRGIIVRRKFGAQFCFLLLSHDASDFVKEQKL